MADQRALLGLESPPAIPEVSVDDQVARALSRVGSMLNGRWRLDRLLGTGGMAAVYAATHRNGNRVAIKILHPELSGYAELKERFLEEGYAANNVEHPGVVAVHDDGISEGSAFLVMDLLEGETLEARRQREIQASGVREVLWIAERILEILEAAHAKGIVHRDIKPENVFLTEDYRLKLLDFGIARYEHSRRTQRTRAGSAMGTPAFMPPEQARGHADQIDGRTDLWALGATLFTLLTGRFVRTANTPNEELLQAMTQPAPPVSAVAPHVPAPVARLIDTALAFEKDARFASASAMRAAVVAAREELDAAGAGSEPLPPLDPTLERSAVLLPSTTTTHRPVTSSHATPLRAGVRRGRWRLPVMLSLGAALGALVAWVPLFRGSAPVTPIAREPAALSVLAKPAAASPAPPPPSTPPSVESEQPKPEAEAKRPSAPRVSWRARKSAASVPPAASSVPPAQAAAPQTRDPLSRRK